MPTINFPPSLRAIFTTIEARLQKLETGRRFTAPATPQLTTTPTISGSASGDPSVLRVGDIWLNTTSNTPKYVDSTGAVTPFSGSSFSIYTASATRFLDFSVSTAAQSLLNTSSTGFIINADTAYEYQFYTSIQFGGIAVSQIPTISIASATVTGTNAMTHVSHFDFGSNTTSFATSTTMSSVRTTTGASIGASGTTNRYYEMYGKGIIRVTGTGTARLYPSMAMNSTDPDNSWSTLAGLTFKLTPLGNSSVTTIGTIG